MIDLYTSYTPKTWEFGFGFGLPHPDYKIGVTEIYILLGPYTVILQIGKEEHETVR